MIMDIGTLVGRLSDNIEALCLQLLPAGVKEANEWRVGSIQGEAGRSMAVNLGSAKAGVWCDFGGPPDHRGDALDLIAQVRFGGDKKQALRWARAWLGIDRVDPNSIAGQQQARDFERRRRKQRDHAERIRRLAQHLVLSARQQIAGSMTEEYLVGRAIDFARLGRQPGCLRHHDEVEHPETGELAPCKLQAITAPDGSFLGVHRTWLERRSDGSVGKLSTVEDAKMTLGTYAGGCVRLWRGSTGKAWKDTQPGEWILIGEGFEDTATGVMARPDLRACVAVSLANMGGLVLPEAAEGVIILAQNDPLQHPEFPDRPHPARQQLDRVVQNFQLQGKRVRIARPLAGEAHDVNELAQQALGRSA